MRGAYHFFRPGVDGKTQALNFLANYHPKPGDLPPVLDIEETDGQSATEIRKEAKAWLRTVEQSIGAKPIVYTLPHFANSYLDGELSQYKLWVVDLGWFWPAKSKGWDAWTFWQYKHTGRLEGISGDVDLNYFNGSMADLERLRLK
jgi:lysozyme